MIVIMSYIYCSIIMHKITHKQKFVALNHPEKLVVQSGTKSLFDFVKQSITTIGQKSSVAFVKL